MLNKTTEKDSPMTDIEKATTVIAALEEKRRHLSQRAIEPADERGCIKIVD